MLKLTKKMVEVLKKADIASGEINNVPLSTMYGLANRKLVISNWDTKSSLTTAGGTFPVFDKVKLTPDGLKTAKIVKGLEV